jgi:GTP-binding protein
VFADIPGLIEGAHTGVGLGYEFLRHIERTRLLLHLVDLTAEDPLQDYQIIQQELEAYGKDLIDRPQVLALNKVDAVLPEDVERLKTEFSQITRETIVMISAVSRTGLEELLQLVWDKLDDLAQEEVQLKSSIFKIEAP